MKTTTKSQRKDGNSLKQMYNKLISKASKHVIHYTQSTNITLEDYVELVDNSKCTVFSTRTGIALLLHRTGKFINVVKFYKYSNRIDLFTDVWLEKEYDTRKRTIVRSVATNNTQLVKRLY